MRTGQNPAKLGLPAYQPKKLGLALLSYIPSQEGYYAHLLEILKIQIASIYRSTESFDLLVFDNGSCPAVQSELCRLQSDGFIQFLILSKLNVGKTGALNWILGSMQNEIIGFSDADVLFRSGWWENSMEVLQAFPMSGLVSAQPCLFDFLPEGGQARKKAENNPLYRLSTESLDDQTVEEYGRGIGLEEEKVQSLKQTQYRVIEESRSGIRAIVGPSHMQFILPRAVARQIIPLPASRALFREETKKINEQIDLLDLLQLTTLKPYVYHMGNRLDEKILAEIQLMDLESILKQPAALNERGGVAKVSPAKQRGLGILAKLSRWAFFRRTLQRLYNFLFEYYAQAK